MLRSFLVLISLSTILLSQPMDWSHHYDNLADALDYMCFDNFENLLCVGNFTRHSNVVLFPTQGFSTCQNHLFDIKENGCNLINRKNGEFWVFKCKDTITIFKDGNYSTRAKTIIDSSIYNVMAALSTSDDRVIFATGSKKLFVYENDSIKPFPWPTDLNDYLLPCLEDSKKRIWAKTWASGIFCYVNNQWISFNKSNSNLRSNNNAAEGKTIIEDRAGNIIVATQGGDSSGLFIYNGSTWERKAVTQNISYYNNIMSIARDSIDALWLGTENGLVRMYKDSTYFYTIKDVRERGSPVGNIRDIIVDKYNRVFFGTYHNCIYMLDQNESFSCKDVQKIELTLPFEQSQWHSGDTMMIRWDSYGCSDTVSLQYKVEGQDWLPCVNNNEKVLNFFYKSWKIPATCISGNYLLSVSDNRNSSVGDTLHFQISSAGQNIPPQLPSTPDSITVKCNTTTTWTAHATDPDKDTLTFQFSNLPQWITAKDSVLTINPDNLSSSTTIKLVVSDGKGGVDSASIRIIPVPAVNITAFDKKIEKQMNITISKNGILASFPKNTNSIVNDILIYNCAGKCLAKFNKTDSGYFLNRNYIVSGSGIYYCIIYSAKKNPLFARKITLVD